MIEKKITRNVAAEDASSRAPAAGRRRIFQASEVAVFVINRKRKRLVGR